MDKNLMTGMALTLLGGALWGLSGTSVQFIDTQRGVNLEWLVTIRLLMAGSITFCWAFVKGRAIIFNLASKRSNLLKLAIFSLFGISLCQYAYFRAIASAGVGIATVLQYVGPTLIIVYLFLRYHKAPTRPELISVMLAFLGTVCIIFHNGMSLADMNAAVVFWGMLSAIGIAVYSIQPIKLLQQYGTGPVMGLAMVFGGIVAGCLFQSFEPGGVWDMWTYLAVFGGNIFLGTVVSFNAYMEGIKRIGAVKGSILSSVEPISAAVLGWWLLGNQFTTLDIIGFILILTTVFILAVQKKS